jgi:hypothetical protein
MKNAKCNADFKTVERTLQKSLPEKTIYRDCPAGTKVGQNWYQSNRKDKLYCRQVSFTMPQGTTSREEHKRT